MSHSNKGKALKLLSSIKSEFINIFLESSATSKILYKTQTQTQKQTYLKSSLATEMKQKVLCEMLQNDLSSCDLGILMLICATTLSLAAKLVTVFVPELSTVYKNLEAHQINMRSWSFQNICCFKLLPICHIVEAFQNCGMFCAQQVAAL